MTITKKFIISIIVLMTFAVSNNLYAQVAVKTNVLSDVALSPSLGVEVAFKDHLSFDMSGSFAFWNTWSDMKMKHWLLFPELRFWPCETLSGRFWGVHLLGGQFNFANIDNNISFLGTDFSKLSDQRYQGWTAGAGVTFGYALPLGLHWNLEGEIGAGYAFADYEHFECYACGKKVGEDQHHYFGPTKAAIKIVYLF